MQKQKTFLILALAIFFGFLASYSMYQFLRSQKQPEEAKVTTIEQPVILANKDLARGAVVDKDDIKAVQWPISKIPRNSFAEEGEVINRIVRREITKGSAVLTDDLLPVKTVIEEIPEGMRALPLEVEGFMGDETMFVAGGFVDILATFKTSDKKLISKLVLQNVKLLAIPQSVEKKERRREKRDVVVAVSPEDAEALALAQKAGDIFLVTRTLTDKSYVVTPGADITDLKKMGSERWAFLKKIPEGKRAVSLWTLSAILTEDFLQPGAHVDIAVAFTSPESGKQVVKTLLQNIEVLAIRTESDITVSAPGVNIRGTASEVVVAVEPQNAEALLIASSKGSVVLLPRTLDDNSVVDLRMGTSEDDILKTENTVEVIRGTAKKQEVLSPIKPVANN
ncbi:MAG: Flp pilus assembly protein CpaB [Candidatus Omnitrophica bacterium]|nr:Flp pilus assembly protein CpaB [Candidatus Omnitrophota bacterium]